MFFCKTVTSFLPNVAQKVKEGWHEKLHDWESALSAYYRRQMQDPDDINLSLGRMRCLEALGEWYELFNLKQFSSIKMVQIEFLVC